MTTVPLYALGDELEEIVDAIVELEGELTPELAERLEDIGGAFDEKVERCALFIQNLTAMAKVAESEAKRLRELAEVRTKTAARLKAYVKEQMQRTDRTKIETGRVKAWIQRNGRPSINWPGPDDTIPKGFERVMVMLDGTKAYEAHKAGTLPEGFEVDHGSHLRIK